VSVRVRLGARLGPLNELSVVSGFSQVGQSVLLMDNDVHSPTLVRPCSDGLTSLRIFSGPYPTCGGGDGRANRSILAGRVQQVAPRITLVDRWMPLLSEPAQQSRVEPRPPPAR
jgi:hypothetical protein